MRLKGQLLSFTTTAVSAEYGVTAARLEVPIAHTLQSRTVKSMPMRKRSLLLQFFEWWRMTQNCGVMLGEARRQLNWSSC